MPLLMNEHAPATTIAMTDAELAARVQLAGCYRVFDLLGWTEMIFNHITLRVPGPEPGLGKDAIFLINPFGLHYSEVTASNLVAVDLDGHPVRPSPHPINRAGFVTHAAIHRALPQAHCVMHTHTTHGCAVACLEGGLSHDSFYGAQLHGQVAYHDFEGVTVNLAEQARMVADIGNKRAVILRNHGLLAWGHDLPNAFVTLWTMQRACDIQIAASAAGRSRPLPAAVLAQCVAEAAAAEGQVCEMVLASLLRQVDARDPSYRD